MKTVLIADKNGQLGNQLFLFAHFISNSIENKYRLYFPAFNDLSVYFEGASRNKFGDYPVRCRIFRSKTFNNAFLLLLRLVIAVLFRTIPSTKWYRIIRLYHTYDRNIQHYSFYNIEQEEEFKKKADLLLLQGWSFRSPGSLVRQREKVRPLFELTPYWRKRVDSIIEKYRKDIDLLIGVHIRRGDYKTFLGGIYFYEDDVYRNYMIQVMSLFPGKKIRFMVCSNEKVSIAKIDGCDIVYPEGHFIEDLYSLAGCDYLMGPPSTFSQWASYFGNVPLRILWEDKKPITAIDEFKITDL